MFSQNAPNEDYGQQFAHKMTQGSTNVIDFEDPAKTKILNQVLNAFIQDEIPDGQPGLRIDDVCDLSGFKEGFVRDRLGELVEGKLLSCVPGSGRRPSYYFPVNHDSLIDQESIDQGMSSDSMNEANSTTLNPGLADVQARKVFLQNELDRIQSELKQCQFAEEYLLQLKDELNN